MAGERIYISTDTLNTPQYERKRQTDIVNAAVRAAADLGAVDITVADNGGLLPELLLPDSRYISGSLPWCGLDSKYTAALLFGSFGCDCVWPGRGIAHIRIGGMLIDSPGLLLGVMASCLGVRVAVAIGCDLFTRSVKIIIPETHVITLSERVCGGIHRLHPERARKAVTDGVNHVLRCAGSTPPIPLRTPITCEVEYLAEEAARRAALIPGVSPVRLRTVSFCGEYENIRPVLELILTCL